MVDKGVSLNCTDAVTIHMIDVRTLVQAFINAARISLESGSAFTVCDQTPVALRALVDTISQELFHADYPKIKVLPTFAFRIAEGVSDKILGSELWKARFQLISRSWYYDPRPAEKALAIRPKDTIPNFAYAIDWYKNSVRR